MQNALTGKRVLITQATEFMGPVLCEVFAEQGAKVVASAADLSEPGAARRVVEEAGPIDVLVANTRALVPGCIINVRPIGVLIMEDNAGTDEKVIAVPTPKLTLRYANVHNYSDLPEITLQQIEHFFTHYKDLEAKKWVRIGTWGDAEEARRITIEAIDAYNNAKTYPKRRREDG